MRTTSSSSSWPTWSTWPVSLSSTRSHSVVRSVLTWGLESHLQEWKEGTKIAPGTSWNFGSLFENFLLWICQIQAFKSMKEYLYQFICSRTISRLICGWHISRSFSTKLLGIQHIGWGFFPPLVMRFSGVQLLQQSTYFGVIYYRWKIKMLVLFKSPKLNST